MTLYLVKKDPDYSEVIGVYQTMGYWEYFYEIFTKPFTEGLPVLMAGYRIPEDSGYTVYHEDDSVGYIPDIRCYEDICGRPLQCAGMEEVKTWCEQQQNNLICRELADILSVYINHHAGEDLIVVPYD